MTKKKPRRRSSDARKYVVRANLENVQLAKAMSALRHGLPVGANPTRQLSLQPVAIKTTRRMHPDLCRFISEAVYEGRLTSDPHAASRRLILHAGSDPALKPSGLTFGAAEHEGGRQKSDEGNPACARVGTVDKFQGQEAAVVVVSMATSSAEDMPRNLEFLFSLNPHQCRDLARPVARRPDRESATARGAVRERGADAIGEHVVLCEGIRGGRSTAADAGRGSLTLGEG